MPHTPTISKNILFVYTRIAVITLIGLFTTRYSLLALGQSDYGLYGVVGGVIAILGIISTAMSTTTRRFINVEMGKTDNSDLNKVFNSCLITNILFAGFLFLLAETLGLLYIYNYLNVEPDKFQDAVIIFHISTATAAISLVNIPHQSLIAANEHFGTIAIIDCATQLLKLLGILGLFLFAGDRLTLYALIMCGITLISLIAYSAYCRRNWKEVVKFKLIRDVGLYKNIALFNNYIALGATSYVARAQGSNMLINYFFGTVVNAAVSIAYAIEGYAIMIVSNLSTAAAPRITKEYSAGNIDESVRQTCRINRLSILFMLVIVFISLIELPFFLKLWLGIVPEGCLVLCQWTLICAFVRSFFEGLPPIVQASGKLKWFQITSSILQCIVLPIGYVLFKMGFPTYSIIVCFIITTMIDYWISIYILRTIIDKKQVLRILKSSFGATLKVSPILVIYFVAYIIFFPTINPVLNIIIAGIVSTTAIYLLGLLPQERDFVKTKLKGIL